MSAEKSRSADLDPTSAPAPGTAADAERIDRLFRALASAPRREILRMLATGEGAEGPTSCCGPHDVCACTFADHLGLGAPTVSHHMRVLKEAGLVLGEKRGLWVYYRLSPGAMDEAMRLVGALQVAAGGASQ
jgi:ArsR family transcriptional regulator